MCKCAYRYLAGSRVGAGAGAGADAGVGDGAGAGAGVGTARLGRAISSPENNIMFIWTQINYTYSYTCKHTSIFTRQFNSRQLFIFRFE